MEKTFFVIAFLIPQRSVFSIVYPCRWKTRKYGLLWWVIDEQEKSFAALGDGGNVIYVNPKEQIVIAIGSYFKPRILDRMDLIKEYIEPMLISNFDVV